VLHDFVWALPQVDALRKQQCVGTRRLSDPVVAAARIDGIFAVSNMNLGAIAVRLDFTKLTRSGWRLLLQHGVARLDEPGMRMLGGRRADDRFSWLTFMGTQS